MDTKTRRGLLQVYQNRTPEVRWYLEHLPALIEEFPLHVGLSYVFSRVELAHNMSLYCGIVKLHRADAVMARRAVDKFHMTRSGYRERFEVVYARRIPASASTLIESAEATRDKVMHGKETSDQSIRSAIGAVLIYAEEINSAVKSLDGPAPFGRLRGFKGRGKTLDQSTSRWMLRGMGFDLS